MFIYKKKPNFFMFDSLFKHVMLYTFRRVEIINECADLRI